MHDKELVKHLGGLLDRFASRKREVGIEIMNLLSHILREGRLWLTLQFLDPYLGAALLTTNQWSRLAIVTEFICSDLTPANAAILLQYITALLYAATKCLRSDGLKCWAFATLPLLRTLLAAMVVPSHTVVNALHQYESLFSLFDYIGTHSYSTSYLVITDVRLIEGWTQLLSIAAKNHFSALATGALDLLAHVITNTESPLAILRKGNCMEDLCKLLRNVSVNSQLALLQSLFNVLAEFMDDPSLFMSCFSIIDISSLLTPSIVSVIMRSALLDPAAMAFLLYLIMCCLPRCS